MRNPVSEAQKARQRAQLPPVQRKVVEYARRRVKKTRSLLELAVLEMVVDTASHRHAEERPNTYSWEDVRHQIRKHQTKAAYEMFQPVYHLESYEREMQSLQMVLSGEYKQDVELILRALLPEIECVCAEVSKCGVALWLPDWALTRQYSALVRASLTPGFSLP